MARDFSKAFDFNLNDSSAGLTVHIGVVAIIFVGLIVGVHFFLPAHKESGDVYRHCRWRRSRDRQRFLYCRKVVYAALWNPSK